MSQEEIFNQRGLTQNSNFNLAPLVGSLNFSRKVALGLILVIALFAFELFNFDTTRFALQNLLGDTSFLNLQWAAILAVAFCAIDFAGLARLFTPEQRGDETQAVWYLMGAWLLGASMNALMTWWAISLTLLNHELGNEILSREQLLQGVPIFVATLVWLTRILFIGALSVAGDHLFDLTGSKPSQERQRPNQQRPFTQPLPPSSMSRKDKRQPLIPPQPRAPLIRRPYAAQQQAHRRPPVRQRTTPATIGMQASGRDRTNPPSSK